MRKYLGGFTANSPKILNAIIIAVNAAVLAIVAYIGYWEFVWLYPKPTIFTSTVVTPYLITAGIFALVNLGGAFSGGGAFAQKMRLRGSLVPVIFLVQAVWEGAPSWFLPAGIVVTTIVLPRLFPVRLFPDKKEPS